MKTTCNLNSDTGRAIAIANYLSTKPCAKRYLVEYSRDSDDFDPGFFLEFSEEQLALAKELIDHAEEDGDWLWAYLEDDESKRKYSFLQMPGDVDFGEFLPTKIHIDNPVNVYKFRLALFENGFDEKPRMLDCLEHLTDEEYATLLEWRLLFRNYDFHSLSYAQPELFQKLTHDFDSRFLPIDIPPYGGPAYLVEMTEVEEDVKKILESNE
jgi:hypothetical protein